MAKKIVSIVGATVMMAGCFLPAWHWPYGLGSIPFMYGVDGQIVMVCGAAALIFSLCGKGRIASIGGWLGIVPAAYDFVAALDPNSVWSPGIACPVIFIGATILISAGFVPAKKTGTGWNQPPAQTSWIEGIFRWLGGR
jgi:hypothetical protein